MATNTSASSTTHTGNGTAGPFSLSFNYLDEDEIDVTVDGALKTLTTHYTFPSASTISFTSGNHPTNGAAIKFQRDTNISSKKVDFQDGSVLTEADLDNNTNQILYGLQEFVDLINDGVVRRDGTLPMTGDLQMDVGRSIIFEAATADAHETKLSVADATADRTVTLPNTTGTVVTTGDTGTVTSTMLADGTIATGDIANNSVTTAKIVDDAVTGAKIADNAITSAHIADGTVVAADIGANAVTASELADDAVDTAAIANSAVTNAKLGADAVNGSKIADDSINSEHYVDGSIDTAHIADSQITAAKLASNAVTTAKINADAVDGTKIADDSINSEHYVDGSIDTAHIADSQVTTAKIADDAVTAAKIADGSITSAHIAADTVVAADIAANAITASELADNAVDTAAIADNAVTNAKMADDSVTASEIAANAVGASELADNAVDTAAIAADAVTGAKIADDAINSEHYTDGSIDTAHIADAQITTAKLADDAVTAAKVGTFNLADLTNVHTATPNDGQVLKWVNSNSRWEPAADAQGSVTDGDYGEITVSSSGSAFTIDNDVITGAKIADDAVGSEHIEVLDAALQFGDNVKAQFGAGNDLWIYHDGSNSFLEEVGTGGLYFRASAIGFRDTANNNDIWLDMNSNAGVDLYYDNALQCKTASYGLDFADNKRADFGAGNDLLIYHNGTNSIISNNTGTLLFTSNDIWLKDGDDGDVHAKFIHDGAVELYYDNAKRLETTSSGITIPNTLTVSDGANLDGDIKFKGSGDDDDFFWDKSADQLTLTDGRKIRFGDSGDLEIYHDGTDSTIKNATGNLDIITGSTSIDLKGVDGSETLAKFSPNGAVELYYDNVKTFNTVANGIEVRGTEGVEGHIYLYADEGDDVADWWLMQADQAVSGFYIRNKASGSWEDNIKCFGNGAVELYYDGVKKAQTYANGLELIQNLYMQSGGQYLSDNVKIHLGNSNDFTIYHDGSNSYIKDAGTGSLLIDSDSQVVFRTDSFTVNNAANSENILVAAADGAVELYYDGSKKFSTESTGPHLYGLGAGSGHSDVRYQTSNGRLYYDSSTRLVKTDISDSHYGIDALKQLKPRKYKRIDIEGTPNEIGFIADEVVSVIPEIVPFGPKSFYTKNDSDTEEIPINVDYRRMTVVLTKALQEAITKIETLETKVAALESA